MKTSTTCFPRFPSRGEYVRPCFSGSQTSPQDYTARLSATIGNSHRVMAVEGKLVRLADEGRGVGASFLCSSWIRCRSLRDIAGAAQSPGRRPSGHQNAPERAPAPAQSADGAALALLPDLIACLEVTTAQLGIYLRPQDLGTAALIAESRALLARCLQVLGGGK